MKKLLFIICMLALSGASAHAQKTPTPNALVEFFNNQGQPCAGCQLSTCGAGLSCPLSPGVNAQATYTTAAGGSQNSNPIILDSNGRANIWLTPTQAYKYALFDPVGNALWTVDNIPGASSGSAGLTVGTTTISGGTSGNFEYNNAGVLGEKGATGTGNVVLSASPTLTGTATLANATLTNLTVTGTCTGCSAATGLTVGSTSITSGTNGDIEFNNSGVLGEKGTTGTGSVVLATAPTVSNLTVTGSCTGCGSATGLTVGSTTITSGTNGDIEFNNSGVLGEKGTTGTGSVVLAAGPTLTGTTTVGNLSIGGTCTGCSSGLTVGGTTISSGTNGQLLYQNSGVLGQVVLEDFPSFRVSETPAAITFANSNTNGTTFIGTGTAATDFNGLFISHSGGEWVVISYPLGAFWTGNVDLNLEWFQTSGGSGNVVFNIQTKCVTSGSASSASFNAAQTSTVSAGSTNTYNVTSKTSITSTGCSAGYTLMVRVGRDATDTYANGIGLAGLTLGVRHTQ